MAKKKATSSDVAKKAGVSQATVSMVLNKKYNVSFSRETVEKVEMAARELGYQLPGRRNKKESKKDRLIVVFCLYHFSFTGNSHFYSSAACSSCKFLFFQCFLVLFHLALHFLRLLH